MAIFLEVGDNVPVIWCAVISTSIHPAHSLPPISHEVKHIALRGAQRIFKWLQGQGTAIEWQSPEASLVSMFWKE